MDLELDKMTDEELIYALGEFLTRKDSPILFAIAVSSAALELESRGILVKDNGLGNSWIVRLENCSLPNPLMYEEYAWESKSKAWLFWAGLDMPLGAQLVCTSDPIKEMAKITSSGVVDIGAPHLTVVPDQRT